MESIIKSSLDRLDGALILHDDKRIGRSTPDSHLRKLEDTGSLTFPTLAALGSNYNTTVTYRELLSRTRQTINALLSIGLSSKDTVSILLPQIPHAYIVGWAAQTLCTAHLIDPNRSREDIAIEVAASRPKVLVAFAPLPGIDLWAKAKAAADETTSIETIFTVDLRPYLPKVTKFMTSIYMWNNRRGKLHVKGKNAIDFDQYVNGHSQQLPPDIRVHTEQLYPTFT